MLSDEEKVRVRHHLGYLNVGSAGTFAMCVPAAQQALFIVDGAMDKVLPEAEPIVRDLISRLDAVEVEMTDSLENQAAKRVDEIEINDKHFEKCVQRYRWWQQTLANLLASPTNPYDQRFGGWGSKGSLNISVRH